MGLHLEQLKRQVNKNPFGPHVGLSARKIKTQPVYRVSQAGFPGGQITLLAGLTGAGKTTTILKLLTANAILGDGRPFIYYGRENSITDFIVPRIEWFGGQTGQTKPTCLFVSSPDYKRAEDIPVKLAKDTLLSALATGAYSAVVIDPVFLLLNNERNNKEIQEECERFKELCHRKTAIIWPCGLAKDIKGKNIIQQIRGGSELTGQAGLVLYIREGKALGTRVMVQLKDRYSGFRDKGFLLTMAKPTGSDIKITPLEGPYEELLNRHGSGFISAQINQGSIITAVQDKLSSYESGDFLVDEFYRWAFKTLSLPEHTARRALKQAGFFTNKKGFQGQWAVYRAG